MCVASSCQYSIALVQTTSELLRRIAYECVMRHVCVCVRVCVCVCVRVCVRARAMYVASSWHAQGMHKSCRTYQLMVIQHLRTQTEFLCRTNVHFE